MIMCLWRGRGGPYVHIIFFLFSLYASSTYSSNFLREITFYRLLKLWLQLCTVKYKFFVFSTMDCGAVEATDLPLTVTIDFSAVILRIFFRSKAEKIVVH